jgi:uncharacterized protein YbbK (DUF523 family)
MVLKKQDKNRAKKSLEKNILNKHKNKHKNNSKKGLILCSACLLGINCRYDATPKTNERILQLSKEKILIPVCPEQLGGLTTPRARAETTSDGKKVLEGKGRVMNVDDEDVTEEFLRGAYEVLRIAKMYNITEAILKQDSPSCGCGVIYDGTFSGRKIVGDGVTAALLKKHNIDVKTEEDFEPGLKTALKKLSEMEHLDVKSEVLKEFRKIEKMSKKNAKKKVMIKCCECNEENASYFLKGSIDGYCKECALEHFSDLKHLEKRK